MADITKLNMTYATKEKLTSAGMNKITGKVDELVEAANTQASTTSDLASKINTTKQHSTLTEEDGWTSGAYNNDGTFNSSSSAYKSSNKLILSGNTLTFNSAPQLIAFWSGDTFKGRVDNRSQKKLSFEIENGVNYVAIMLNASDIVTNFSVSGLAPYVITNFDVINDKIDDINDVIGGTVPSQTTSLVFESGNYYKGNTGESIEEVASIGWSYTHGEVKAGDLITFNCNSGSTPKPLYLSKDDGKIYYISSSTSGQVTAEYDGFVYANKQNTNTNASVSVKRSYTIVSKIKEIDSKIGESLSYCHFSVDVRIGFSNNQNSSSVETEDLVSTDNACLLLPYNYQKSGNPSRLVIYNHGAGWLVSESSCFIQSSGATFAKFLAKKGYAVLEVNGLPEYYHKSWNEGYWMNNYGSPIAIRCIERAYRYVVDNYNICKDGCFVIGTSMGGLTTNNMVNNSVIPVKAVMLDAPVIDLQNDAWNSGGWGVSPHQYEALTIALLYHFKNCTIDIDNPSDSTFTVENGDHKGTYNFLEVSVGGNELMSFFREQKENIKGWLPTENRKVLVDNNSFGLMYPHPIKIWHGDQDATNQIQFSKDFVEMVKKCGMYAEMRSIPTNYHTPLRQTDWGSTKSEGLTISNEAYEMWLWMEQF